MSWNGVKKQINKAEIEAWCEEMGIKRYTINSQGEIDVDGDVFLDSGNFKELPYKFGKIDGYFSLQWCKNLISLKNCPDFVKGSFSCSFGKCIKSLEYCPKRVGGDFYCRCCKRKFTSEEVRSLCKVKRDIWC